MSGPPSNTNVGILAAGIYPTLAALRAATPPLVQRFARVLGFPRLLRFAPLDASADDGWTAIVPGLGGGAWLDAPVVDRGTDLTPANGYPAGGPWTIGAYGGPWRVIPAATLTGNVTATLDPKTVDGATAIRAGESIFVARLDATGNTVAWVNGGAAGGTLCTFPANQQAWLWAWFDGANYVKRGAGLML
jgi:hypothetical protein